MSNLPFRRYSRYYLRISHSKFKPRNTEIDIFIVIVENQNLYSFYDLFSHQLSNLGVFALHLYIAPELVSSLLNDYVLLMLKCKIKNLTSFFKLLLFWWRVMDSWQRCVPGAWCVSLISFPLWQFIKHFLPPGGERGTRSHRADFIIILTCLAHAPCVIIIHHWFFNKELLSFQHLKPHLKFLAFSFIQIQPFFCLNFQTFCG